jgi:uncharacterized protein
MTARRAPPAAGPQAPDSARRGGPTAASGTHASLGLVVKDNPRLNRFELETDGQLAFAAYQREHGVVTFTHTEVPHAFRGKGIGSALAKGALELARERGERVVPRCSFIATFMRKHPEFQDLLQG